MTGFSIALGMSPISWKSKKQHTISCSSVEAEYHSIAFICELKCPYYLLKDLRVPQSSPTPLFCDNQTVLHISSNPVFHQHTKHIEIDCHFVRNEFQASRVTPTYIPTHAQHADIFT